jgi:hypothetical protein
MIRARPNAQLVTNPRVAKRSMTIEVAPDVHEPFDPITAARRLAEGSLLHRPVNGIAGRPGQVELILGPARLPDTAAPPCDGAESRTRAASE